MFEVSSLISFSTDAVLIWTGRLFAELLGVPVVAKESRMEQRGIEQQDSAFNHSDGQRESLKAKLSELGLSRRQTEVALLAVSGLSNREIADRLFIAEQTVKDHFFDIYQRAGVHRRYGLIAKLLGLDTHAHIETGT